jgi:hypothetical protein
VQLIAIATVGCDYTATRICFFARNVLSSGSVILLEINMKKVALAAALSFAATSAFAGGMSEPVIEPMIVEAETSSSDGGLLIPIALLLVIAAVASN